MPCEWRGDNILVLSQIQIAPPYTPDTCTPVVKVDSARCASGLSATHQLTPHRNRQAQSTKALERLKMVLKAERERLGMPAA
jgi:hypothetical protein